MPRPRLKIAQGDGDDHGGGRPTDQRRQPRHLRQPEPTRSRIGSSRSGGTGSPGDFPVAGVGLRREAGHLCCGQAVVKITTYVG